MIYGFNKAAVLLPNAPPPRKETVQTSPECTVGLSDPGKMASVDIILRCTPKYLQAGTPCFSKQSNPSPLPRFVYIKTIFSYRSWVEEPCATPPESRRVNEYIPKKIQKIIFRNKFLFWNSQAPDKTQQSLLYKISPNLILGQTWLWNCAEKHKVLLSTRRPHPDFNPDPEGLGGCPFERVDCFF